jgi:hypothetical protein
VRQTENDGNYVRFFRLYKEAPNLGPFLMDVFLDKYRVLALRTIAVVHVMGIDLEYLKKIMVFESEKEAVELITKSGGILSPDGKMLKCKESIGPFMKAALPIRRKS